MGNEEIILNQVMYNLLDKSGYSEMGDTDFEGEFKTENIRIAIKTAMKRVILEK
jgi:hypothetical protein